MELMWKKFATGVSFWQSVLNTAGKNLDDFVFSILVVWCTANSLHPTKLLIRNIIWTLCVVCLKQFFIMMVKKNRNRFPPQLMHCAQQSWYHVVLPNTAIVSYLGLHFKRLLRIYHANLLNIINFCYYNRFQIILGSMLVYSKSP